MRNQSKHQAYGILVSLKKPLKIGHDGFGQFPNYYSVTENVRLSHGSELFQSKKMTEKYMEELIPIFNKRYCEGMYEMFLHKADYSNHQTHKRVLSASEVLNWRLKNRNFNPKEKP